MAAAKPAASSQIDSLVQQLPARGTTARPPATGTAAAPVPMGERWRYRVADSRQPGNADNFDAWMKSQGVRVATGKPTAATPRPAAAAAVATTVAVARTPDAPPAPRPAAPVIVAKPPTAAEAALGDILLQVASFASRENANRALSQLASAGIAGASVSDIVSGGRTLWRLRVNARDHANASEIAQRIAGLGFGRPQIVACLLYTSPSPRDQRGSRMPSSA